VIIASVKSFYTYSLIAIMDAMRNIKLPLVLLTVLVIGCASVTSQRRMGKYEEITGAYGEAIVWSHYEAASLYMKDGGAGNTPPDFEMLKNIKVASYDVKHVKVSDDKSQVTQIVEIQYYKKNQLIISSLRDKQLWEFDPIQRNWVLLTGLPGFK